MDLIKELLKNFLGETLDELKDGFENELDDVLIFFNENMNIVLVANGGEGMGSMMAGMGSSSLMKKV